MQRPVYTPRCVPPLLSLVCSLAWSGCALAQDYTVTILNPIVGPIASGSSVNARGQVVGQTFTLPPDQLLNNNFISVNNAFIYTSGVSQTIGTLGGSASAAQCINIRGNVAGFAQTTRNAGNHAFLYKNGVTLDLGTFGGTTSQAYGINASDQVTGLSEFADGLTFHAFVYTDGAMQDLGALGGNFSVGHAINDSGHVAGEVQPLGKVLQAFLYRDGAMEALGTLGGLSSQAYGITASDQVTGKSDVSINNAIVHAFLYSNGLMKDLGTLGGTESVGLGINLSGEVVGQSATTGNAASHAFLYKNRKMVDLNSLLPSSIAALYTLTNATSINDSGQIVANGYLNSTLSTAPDQSLAFLLTPIAIRHTCPGVDEATDPERECEPGDHRYYPYKRPLDHTKQLSQDKQSKTVPDESHNNSAHVFEGSRLPQALTTRPALQHEALLSVPAIVPTNVQIYVSYAESQTPAFFFPNPWYGSPNTQFLGHPGSAYNTGGILIANTGATNVVLTRGAWVDGFRNGKVYKLWDNFIPAQGRTIRPGSTLILAQTTTCTRGGALTCSDFDTSDTTVGKVVTTNSPVIHLTLNGVPQSFTDTGQILNTGGVDIGAKLMRNESMQWRLVGTTSPLFPGGSGVLPGPVSTSRNDISRTGLASSETTLNPNNVNPMTFGKLFAYPVDGPIITGQPLFVRDVLIPNRGLHNVVVVATTKNSVYAFDAENNQGNGGLLWGPISLGPPSPPYGVTGTPVIDIPSGTIYLVSKNNSGVGDVARLHALDLTSGAEKFGGPVDITGFVPGTGARIASLPSSASRLIRRMVENSPKDHAPAVIDRLP